MLANRTCWTEKCIITGDVRQITSNIKIPSFPPFSDFPCDVLKYMKNDATPRQAVKMMKLNKYFLQSKSCFSYIGSNTIFCDYGIFVGYAAETKYGIDELPNNLSINGSLHVIDSQLLPQLISKIVVCEVKCLTIYAQRISYRDFKVLTASGKMEKLGIIGTKIISKNRQAVPYETLLNHVQNLRVLELTYDPSKRLSKSFVEKVCESKLETLVLFGLTEVFNLEAFMIALKRKPSLNIQLFFIYSFHALRKVNVYVDKLVAAGLPDSCPPEIHINAPFSRSKALENLRNTYLYLYH